MYNQYHNYALVLFELFLTQGVGLKRIKFIFQILYKVIREIKEQIYILLYYKKTLFIRYFISIIQQYIYISKYIKYFIFILFEDKMFMYIKLIYVYFIRLYNNYFNKQKIYIYSAHKLPYRYYMFLQEWLCKQKHFRYVSFIYYKQKTLLAGFKIKINDLILDASFLNQLNQLLSYSINQIDYLL